MFTSDPLGPQGYPYHRQGFWPERGGAILQAFAPLADFRQSLHRKWGEPGDGDLPETAPSLEVWAFYSLTWKSTIAV